MRDPRPRAALYARISTREGKQHLETQLAALREYAARMNWNVAAEIADEESGAKDRRPGLDKLMSQAARRDFDIVAVFELSRLTRGGPMAAFRLIERLATSKVEFWSITQEMFRTVGPMGQVLIALAAYFAAEERTTLQRRIHAGIARAREQGTKLGRPKRVINRDRIAELQAAGATLEEIGRELSASSATIHRRIKQQ